MLEALREVYQSFEAIKYSLEKILPIIEQNIISIKQKIAEKSVYSKQEFGQRMEKIYSYLKSLYPHIDFQDETTFSANKEIIDNLISNNFVIEVEDSDRENNEITKYFSEYQNLIRLEKYYRNNAIVNGVMAYETYLGFILKENFSRYPEKVTENKSISVQDLKGFESLNVAYDFLISKEVQEITQSGLEKQMQALHEKLGLKNEHHVRNKKQLTEIYARRNVIVHKNAMSDSIYTRKSQGMHDYQIGEEIISDDKYITESLDILLTNATLIFIELWQKCKTEQLTEEDEINDKAIGNMAFNFLCSKNWLCAKEIYYALTHSERIIDHAKKMYNLNILLCRRHLNEDSIQKIIDKQDYSATDDFLKMGLYALQRKYEELIELFRRNPDSIDFVGEDQLMSWPIFEDVRTDSEVMKELVEICNRKKKKVKSYKIV